MHDKIIIPVSDRETEGGIVGVPTAKAAEVFPWS